MIDDTQTKTVRYTVVVDHHVGWWWAVYPEDVEPGGYPYRRALRSGPVIGGRYAARLFGWWNARRLATGRQTERWTYEAEVKA